MSSRQYQCPKCGEIGLVPAEIRKGLFGGSRPTDYAECRTCSSKFRPSELLEHADATINTASGGEEAYLLAINYVRLASQILADQALPGQDAIIDPSVQEA